MTTKHQFLLADDDEDDRLFFSHACSKFKDRIDLVAVADGKQLLERLSSGATSPSLVILDINMPLMNGFECLSRLRNSEKWHDLPVVMYTTSSDETDIKESFLGGANSFIVKPHSMPAIDKVVETLITRDFSRKPSSLTDFVIKH